MTSDKDGVGKMNFSNLSFNDFRKLAQDSRLSRHEKVGFPDQYREGNEEAIFSDMRNKLPNLNSSGKTVLEIGPGCSNLPIMLSSLCHGYNNELIYVDSAEMLSHLPAGPGIKKIEGMFPDALHSETYEFVGTIDVIIAYSVLQYVFTEGNLWRFVDQCLLLLADGGEILFGDIPNITMRKRFFDSEAGVTLHRNFTGHDVRPEVHFNTLELGQMDDSVIFAILARARAQGYHAWVMPQATGLPMANRREDVLIRKP
jgi:hypothetical protein